MPRSASGRIPVFLFCSFTGTLVIGYITHHYQPWLWFARERENAGLNVTCASRVFLVESVVHHAFELQGW